MSASQVEELVRIDIAAHAELQDVAAALRRAGLYDLATRGREPEHDRGCGGEHGGDGCASNDGTP
jgi:hypothetical protein